MPTPTDSAPLKPSLSVMIWTLRKFGTFEQTLDLVAQAGYRNVELIAEFRAWSEADYARILGRMAALNIKIDATTGLKSSFVDPLVADAFLAELRGLMPTLKRLGSPKLIALSGPVLPSADAGVQHEAAIATLRRAGPILSAANLTLLLEPIDRLENPTIYLDTVAEACDIVRAVDSPNIRVLYDLYHEQRTHGNLLEKLEQNIGLIDLIHIADVPGRHEPGTGEIAFPVVYRKLRDLGYNRMIAMEFTPTANPLETLRNAREQIIPS